MNNAHEQNEENDPQAVIDAYPNAEVTYWYSGNFVRQV